MANRRQGLFRLEHEMSSCAARWLTQQGLSIKAEFRTRWGICDFVGVAFDPARVRERLALGQQHPIGSELRVLLLNAIPDRDTGKSAHLLNLVQSFSDLLTGSELETEIAQLAQRKFLVWTRSGKLQKVNGWAPLHRRIVAVELKLHRVEDALNQAKNNLAFATHSYVALPNDVAARIACTSRRRLFCNSGIGLLSVGKSGCEVVVPAKKSAEIDPILQTHCVERFWRSNAHYAPRLTRKDNLA